MEQLKRKIDQFLCDWKNNPNHRPLIVKGARQIGKTFSIETFAEKNYKNVIKINFVFDKQYKTIFDDGYEVDTIIKNISFINPSLRFVPHETLFFFDEIQDCIQVATALKAFAIDNRFDVICSGSLMGIKYHQIESVSVGYKEDYEMYSMNFEEFLWAKGYLDKQIDELYKMMLECQPLPQSIFNALLNNFHDYMVVGGMPHIVDTFIKQKNLSGILTLQKQIITDYEEDIVKYASGLDQGKVLNTYHKIPAFLGKDNKKFQISKISTGARTREYLGSIEWHNRAGIINICYCMDKPELPLKGNYNPKIYKIYFRDTGLLIATLYEEAQDDLRANKNFNTYKCALYENMVGDMLVKEGYDLYFYKNEKSTLEMDFFVRNSDALIPIEVKANDESTPSLNHLIDKKEYSDIHFGIKLAEKNIGFNGKFYTFPYFLAFLLKRFLKEKIIK